MKFPSLEYSLSHPHPKGRHFLVATLIIFLLTLPVLIVVNIKTQGSELVPTLQPNFATNNTELNEWWSNTHLPAWFQPKPPKCQPKDIGRGDTFRLTTSLFDYTVMSTLNTSQGVTGSQVQQQIRAEYTGQNFSSCYVNSARFDYSLFDRSQSVVVGVFCPNFPRDDVSVSMQTTMTFAWELSKDFIGQYYGPGLDLLNINETKTDYRKIVLATLEVISTDSLTIMHTPRLSNPAGSIRIVFDVSPETGIYHDTASTITYVNGTQPDQYTAEAAIYRPSITNLLIVALESVRLDLGSKRFSNIFQNATRLGRVINPNFAPSNISPTDWAMNSQAFYYGMLNATKYQTWAQALLDNYPVQVGDLTGLPEVSVMATTYLCPTYKPKPTKSLLSSIFVGTATMTLSVWGTWMFFTAFVAKKIMAPKVQCECKGCVKRRKEEEEEEKKRPTSQAMGGMLSRLFSVGHKSPTPDKKDEEAADAGSGSGLGSDLASSSKVSQLERPAPALQAKHLSEYSTYTIEEKQNPGAV